MVVKLTNIVNLFLNTSNLHCTQKNLLTVFLFATAVSKTHKKIYHLQKKVQTLLIDSDFDWTVITQG